MSRCFPTEVCSESKLGRLTPNLLGFIVVIVVIVIIVIVIIVVIVIIIVVIVIVVIVVVVYVVIVIVVIVVVVYVDQWFVLSLPGPCLPAVDCSKNCFPFIGYWFCACFCCCCYCCCCCCCCCCCSCCDGCALNLFVVGSLFVCCCWWWWWRCWCWCSGSCSCYCFCSRCRSCSGSCSCSCSCRYSLCVTRCCYALRVICLQTVRMHSAMQCYLIFLSLCFTCNAKAIKAEIKEATCRHSELI